MRTFIFTALKNAKDFRKCHVYDGKLNTEEVKQLEFKDEVLINWEYANECTFE